MTSSDEVSQRRLDRLAALRAQIISEAPEPFDDPDELAQHSLDAHSRQVRGDDGPSPTRVTVRVHGEGVDGHSLPLTQAGTLLTEIQNAVTWIGARIRHDLENQRATGDRRSSSDRRGIREATRLYLQPQLGAGSLIFHLVSELPDSNGPSGEEGLPIPEQETMLDRAVHGLLSIVSEAQRDDADDELSRSVRQIGARASSSLNRLADAMVKNDLEMDMAWSNAVGVRKTAKLRRRGALAIRDAVDRNKEQTRVIELVGLLETASVGRDPVRIETADRDYRLDVDEDLGAQLGPLLHQRVRARAEETVVSRDSGRETRRYVLLSAVPEDMLPTSGGGST